VGTKRGGGGRRPTRTVKAVLKLLVGGIVTAFALANAAGAWAAPLAYVGCIANGGKHGCAASSNSLAGAQSIVVSPDGQNVYVAAYFAGSITVFDRDSAGELTQIECLAEYRERGCSRMPHGYLLDGVAGLAVSPDGRSVYAVSDEGIVVFARAPDGSLSFGSCVGPESDGCTQPKRFPALGESVAVSPDGDAVYVVSNGLVAAFSRAPSGRLRPVDCFSDQFSYPHCKAAPFESVLGASTLAVSPGDRSLYVGGFEGLTSFHRRADGTLAFRSCIANGAEGRCVRAPHKLGILWAGVAAPGGGDWVYAASLGDRVSVLAADPDGSITYQGCVTDHTSSSCAQIPDEVLLGTDSMAASPDGAALYIGGLTSVTRLEPGADGTLTFEDCVADRERDRPQACSSTGNDSLQDVRSVAASADGASIYAASWEANAVVVLGG
jgi:DNA-binding beta-propeller fold protein YncE